ncbi:MAG: DJ-1/PfpI family protein [Oscillospiraceae bacterium]|jgi:4-methyl-5(b-hydroxyethyl)-thiazole monophosphate biosynthesis|nr:DJ-1/PfpI family protein [Oscillospiraceae bacterium]
MVFIFLADGVAEMEAVTVTEVLRRAGAEVKTVGVTGMTVTGARGMKLLADIPLGAVTKPDMLVLPGGLKGVENLAASLGVRSMVKAAVKNDEPLGAICAAPKMLSGMGLLKSRTVTCHPSVAEEVRQGGAYVLDRPWVREGALVTGQGPGASVVFGIALAALLLGEEKADALAEELLVSWRCPV